jgi:ribosome-associated protein
MIKINDNLSISSKEINFKMTKSSGPGGQNINKNSTAVTLEFDILNSISLPKKIKQILFDTSHSYLTKTGKIIIKANNYKSQHRNKTEAVSRFITYFNNVLMTKKKRIDTKPTKSSIEKRLNEKRKKSLKKSLRKKPKYE